MATWDYVRALAKTIPGLPGQIQKHVIVGNSSVGKSSLLMRLTDKSFSDSTEPTIGVEFGSKLITLPNGQTIKAHIWDTAGQESFRSITRSYYRGAEGALLVFDVCHRSSWLDLSTWLEDLREFAEEGVVVHLIANKMDLVKAGKKREVSQEEAETFAKENDLEYHECSAKDGQNVEEAFVATAILIHKRIEENKLRRPTRKGGGSFPTLIGGSNNKGGKCC